MGICALCYIANCFGIVRLCRPGFDLWGVHLTWVYEHCAIWDSVALGVTRGMSDLGINALCYIGNCFGVVGLCSSGFNSWGVCLTWVYVHCAISETALV